MELFMKSLQHDVMSLYKDLPSSSIECLWELQVVFKSYREGPNEMSIYVN